MPGDLTRAIPNPPGTTGPAAAAGSPPAARPTSYRADQQAAARRSAGILKNPQRGTRSGFEQVGTISGRLVTEFFAHSYEEDGQTVHYLDMGAFEDATRLRFDSEDVFAYMVYGRITNVPRRDGHVIVTDLNVLAGGLDQTTNILQTMGVSFDAFTGWDHITVVPAEQMIGFMIGLNNGQLRALAQSQQQILWNLMRTLQLPIRDIPGVTSSDPQYQTRAIVETLQALQRDAQRSGDVGQHARYCLMILGAGIMNQLNEALEGSGYSDDGLSASGFNLQDPLCARWFLQTIFMDYALTGSEVTNAELNAARGFGRQIAELRTLCGANTALLTKLNTADPGIVTVRALDGLTASGTEVYQALLRAGYIDQLGRVTERFDGSISPADLQDRGHPLEISAADARALSTVLTRARRSGRKFDRVLSLLDEGADFQQIRNAINALDTYTPPAPPVVRPRTPRQAVPDGPRPRVTPAPAATTPAATAPAADETEAADETAPPATSLLLGREPLRLQLDPAIVPPPRTLDAVSTTLEGGDIGYQAPDLGLVPDYELRLSRPLPAGTYVDVSSL